MTVNPPNPPYLGPPAHFTEGDNKPVKRVVLHSTVSPCERGQARSIANYFRSDMATGSAHYVVDPYEVIQAAYDSVICWHAPPNANSIGVEMCDYPSGGIERWQNEMHQLMLRKVAHLVARLCLAYNVPIRFIGPIRLRLGRKGITTHKAVSDAFHQSTHWDPGAFPRKEFIGMVREYAKRIQERN